MNPLPPDESYLVSLSTGTVATPAVVKDLLRAFEVGEYAYQNLKWTKLDDDPRSQQLAQRHPELKTKMWF